MRWKKCLQTSRFTARRFFNLLPLMTGAFLAFFDDGFLLAAAFLAFLLLFMTAAFMTAAFRCGGEKGAAEDRREVGLEGEEEQKH